MFQTKVVEKINTYILFSVTPPPENRCVYEIMRKNIVQPARPQVTVWRVRIARWVIKATNTHLEYVIHIASPLKNGCTNAFHCYVIRTLPVLLKYTVCVVN